MPRWMATRTLPLAPNVTAPTIRDQALSSAMTVTGIRASDRREEMKEGPAGPRPFSLTPLHVCGDRAHDRNDRLANPPHCPRFPEVPPPTECLPPKRSPAYPHD